MKYNKTKTIEEYVAHLQLMVDDLNAVVTGQNTEISNLKATSTEFENKTNELQRKLHDQEQTARNKIREATKMGRGEREKSRELSQALEENRILRTEIEELEQDRDTLIAALEEQHEEMTKSKQEAEQEAAEKALEVKGW